MELVFVWFWFWFVIDLRIWAEYIKVTVGDATERQSIGKMKMRRGQEISYEERALDKLTETSLVPIFLIVFKGSSNRDTG